MTSTVPAPLVRQKAAIVASAMQLNKAPFLNADSDAANFNPLFFGQLLAIARTVVVLGLFTASAFYLSTFVALTAQEVFGVEMDFDDA